MILLDGTGPIWTQEVMNIFPVDGTVLVQQDQRMQTTQEMLTTCLMDMMKVTISCMVNTVKWDLILLVWIPPFSAE